MSASRTRQIPAIIETVRRSRFIAIGAVLASVTACTSGGGKPAPPPSPPAPGPGQVVIIAGDHRILRYPTDGEYALRTSAHSDGGLAVTASGSVYYEIIAGPRGQIAHLEQDGTITITLMLPAIASDQLAIHGDSMWLMSSYSDMALVRVSLTTSVQTTYLMWGSGQGDKLSVIDASGKQPAPGEPRRSDEYWAGSRFTLRSDGTPVVVSRQGDLYDVPGEGKLRIWKPQGFAAALRSISGKDELAPTTITGDGKGGIVIVGRRGLLRVPRVGESVGIPFPRSTSKLPPWTAATTLDDGSVLLLGGTTATERTPRPTLVRPNGSFELLSWGEPQWCGEFDGTLAVIGSANPGGIVRRPDGTFILSDKSCGQIYRFRLPSTLTGKPYPG